jgi:hypothetical protein
MYETWGWEQEERENDAGVKPQDWVRLRYPPLTRVKFSVSKISRNIGEIER